MKRGSERKNSSGDRVLESKHVIGLFLLMLVFSGVFFSLGYVMGRSQYETQVRADGDVFESVKQARRAGSHSGAAKAPSSSTASPADSNAKAASSDWDFYHSIEPEKSQERLAKMRQPVGAGKPGSNGADSSSSSAPANSSKNDQFHAPLMPGGAIVLQVSASKRQSDALLLAESLQKKGFPAFVLTAGADHFYRVQVGPYANQESANIARKGLENAGFKSIARR
jgi:cell division septation protein DedD